MSERPPNQTEAVVARAREVMARLADLAAISAEAHGVTRLNLSDEHRRANELTSTWMRETGMNTRVDQAGNLIGRYESLPPGAPALVIGSHLDTVRNAGHYDGTLGVLLGVAVVELLASRGRRLPFAVEVVGFADEEGVRFQAGLLGSKAMVGKLAPDSLDLSDDGGVTLRAALADFGLDPDRLHEARRKPREVVGYLEVHIEQGPVLEAEGLPIGLVTAISGAARLRVTVTGEGGHAGTVPMGSRRDALAAASECVLALESLCRAEPGAVGTVGELSVRGGAVNVIPGEVTFSVDVRAPGDEERSRVLGRFREVATGICAVRAVALDIEQLYEAPACNFEGRLQRVIGEAIVDEGLQLRRLPSGAGHDAMAFADFTDAAMLFVRCHRGISHHPDESVTPDDVERALAVTLRAVESLGSLGGE